MDGYNYKKIEQVKNKYVFEISVEYSKYQVYEDTALVELSKSVKVPGFRPGKAPKDLAAPEVASKAFTKAVNKLLPDYALEVLEKEKINPIANVEYSLKDY